MRGFWVLFYCSTYDVNKGLYLINIFISSGTCHVHVALQFASSSQSVADMLFISECIYVPEMDRSIDLRVTQTGWMWQFGHACAESVVSGGKRLGGIDVR